MQVGRKIKKQAFSIIAQTSINFIKFLDLVLDLSISQRDLIKSLKKNDLDLRNDFRKCLKGTIFVHLSMVVSNILSGLYL